MYSPENKSLHLKIICIDQKHLKKRTVYTVKLVYNGQPLGITKVGFVNKWTLFGASETTYLIFMGKIKTGFCGQETTIRRGCYAQV